MSSLSDKINSKLIPYFGLSFDSKNCTIDVVSGPSRMTKSDVESLSSFTSFATAQTALESHICSICIETYADEEVHVLKCGHTFHLECIKSWLLHSGSCPECRIDVTKDHGSRTFKSALRGVVTLVHSFHDAFVRRQFRGL